VTRRPKARAFAAASVSLALALATGVAQPARASGPLLPSQDPFYTYAGQTPLSQIPPGTILKSRSIHVALGTTSTPIAGEQLLYRTTGQLGQPAVTVTTVIQPAPVTVAPRIVEYLSFYDGLGSKCDPSYTLQGGNPGSVTGEQATEEELLLNWYLTNDFTVTIPDFEGTHLDWMAGRESGYGALDAIRATETYLRAGPHTPIGLSGYSGGAVAADWASELAPAYAPHLDIVGVAEGGIPVNYAHMFAYINGTTVYSAAIPGVLLGLARAYHVDLTPYLSPYGAAVMRQESAVCIDEVFSKYPGLTVQRMVKPQYQNFFQVPIFASLLQGQLMGSAAGHPTAPLFMGVGDSDGKGDGVMIAADVESLAREYCQLGDRVDFEEYTGASHEEAGAFFEPETGVFLQARLAGVPFTGNCSTLH
jgi:Secretory lipase